MLRCWESCDLLSEQVEGCGLADDGQNAMMKFPAILLFMMVIRCSSGGYMHNRYGKRTFDYFHCFERNKTIMDLMEATAAKEDRVLGYLEKDNAVPTNALDDYKAAVALERKAARRFIPDWAISPLINPTKTWCKFVRKSRDDYQHLLSWSATTVKEDEKALSEHFRSLGEPHEKFFTTPSVTLDKYYAMKRNESSTWLNFYANGGEDIYDKPTENPFGGESAEAGFECPKKKRESGSVATEMHAQMFVIFLCMVIGIFVVDLQRLEIGEDELRANENAMKVNRGFHSADRILGSVEMRIDCIMQSKVE